MGLSAGRSHRARGRLRRAVARARGRGATGIRVTAALAAVLLTAGLVVRLSVSLTSFSPRVREQLSTTGEVRMTSNAVATPLFARVVLAPGEQVETCVRVVVDSSVDPDPVTLHVDGRTDWPQLARYVVLRVEEGSRRGDGTRRQQVSRDCDGFQPDDELVSTSLSDALARFGPSATPLQRWDPAPGSAARWYRVGLQLAADAPAAVQAQRIDALRFTWTATAVPARAAWVDASLLLASSLAEHSLVPLLVMLAAAILFIGVQDRIDRHDPKLALAAVSAEPLVFAPATATLAAEGPSARTPNGQPEG